MFLPIRLILNLLAIDWVSVELRADLLTFFINVLILVPLHLLSLRVVPDYHCAGVPVWWWLPIHVNFWMVLSFFWRWCCYFLIFLIFVLLLEYLLTLLVLYVFLLLVLLSLSWYWLHIWKLLMMRKKLLIGLQNWCWGLWFWCYLFLYYCKIWIFKVLNEILSFKSLISLRYWYIFLDLWKKLIKWNRFTALTIHYFHHRGFFCTLGRSFSFNNCRFMLLMRENI